MNEYVTATKNEGNIDYPFTMLESDIEELSNYNDIVSAVSNLKDCMALFFQFADKVGDLEERTYINIGNVALNKILDESIEYIESNKYDKNEYNRLTDLIEIVKDIANGEKLASLTSLGIQLEQIQNSQQGG